MKFHTYPSLLQLAEELGYEYLKVLGVMLPTLLIKNFLES